MRIARILLLAALAAIAVSAFTTTNSSAEIHVEQEVDLHTMASCDPCEIHAESDHTETYLFHKQLGQYISRCYDELEGEIYEDGSGHVQLTEALGPLCTITPCVGSEAEWPIQLTEDIVTEGISTTFCVRLPGDQVIHCEVDIDLADEGTHHWVIDSPGRECQSGPQHLALPIAIIGAWEIEVENPHVNIEVAHDTETD
jgi:hypothetical protein